MPLSYTELIGYSEALIEFMKKNKDALAAKKLDVTDWIPESQTEQDDLVSDNEEQEKRKALLREQTNQVEAKKAVHYDNMSTKNDAIIGALGKKSEIGKQAARLRSKIRRGRNKPPPPPQ